MKLWDAHMHCAFSGDSDTPPEEMIHRAKSLGLPGITFTDHLDWDYASNPGEFDLDLPDYVKTITDLANKYSSETFQVQMGLELGLQPHLAERHHALLSQYHFHQVIGSIHQVYKEDPYYPSYMESRSISQGYQDYFDEVLHNLHAFHSFDTLGHLDYVKRYIVKSMGPDAAYHLADYAEIIDEILKLLIRYDIALEINTGSIRYGFMDTNPGADILQRYMELGGKMVTIGADAHTPQHIACGFESLPSMLRNAGFTSYTVFQNRNPVEIPLNKI